MAEFSFECPRSQQPCIYGDYCSITKAAAEIPQSAIDPSFKALVDSFNVRTPTILLEADRSSYCADERVIAIEGAAAHLIKSEGANEVREWKDALIQTIETRREEYIPISSEHSADAKFSSVVIERMKSRGFHAECTGRLDKDTGKWTYDALVMPQRDYDALLEKANLDEEAAWIQAKSLGQVSGEITPFSALPWDVMLDQDMAWGCGTREEALRTAAARYIRPPQ